MGEALEGMPSSRMERPAEGLVDVMIDPVSSAVVDPFHPNAIPEVFMVDPVPEESDGVEGADGLESDPAAAARPEPKSAPRPSGPPIF
jgi:hypothetical protein